MLRDYVEALKHIKLLTPDEERRLWQAYKDDGNMDSRRALIEQYQPLVFKEAMRWHIKQDLLPDALQEGTVGLIEAVERYDYTRNVAFPLFAVHRIRGAIVDCLRREGQLVVSLDEVDENGVTLGETVADERVNIEAQTGEHLLFEHVAKTLERLPKKEQIVVAGVYLEDKEQKHIAHDLSVSLPYVYRLQKRGIRRVRGMLSRFIHDSKR